MSLPDFNQPFDKAYDVLSMYKKWLVIPSWCNTYEPDNNDEYECLTVIQPAPERGSKAWTLNNKRVLLGVFRDQGRPTMHQDVRTVQWTRYGTRLIIGTDRPHYMIPGDKVNLWNVNIPNLTADVVRVFSSTEFEVKTSILGSSSGIDGGYQPVKPINFYEDFIVFRLLPSMKVIPWPIALAIINAGHNISASRPTYITDIKTGEQKLLASKIYQQASMLGNNGSQYRRIHRQQINEDGSPIIGTYNNRGFLNPSKYRISLHQGEVTMHNPILVNEDCDCNPDGNKKLYVYDYYGFDLNDDTRAPYNAIDNVYYDLNTSKLKVRPNNLGAPFYDGKLQDEFGNIVLDAKSDNSLLIRQAILPINVDQYNVPYKLPKKRI